MTRYLKALGLATMAAFAFSAVAASAASAQTGVITSDGPVTLTGTQIEPNLPEDTLNNSFTAFGGVVHCPGATYTGHEANATPHEFIESGAAETTITPNYGEDCVNDEADEITVDMRDCDYTFKDAATTGEVEGTYGILVDVDCDESNGILITGGSCTVRVPPQEGLTGLHATDEGNGHIRIHGTVHSIRAVACGFLTTNEAEQHQDVTVTGHNELGEQTDVSLSH